MTTVLGYDRYAMHGTDWGSSIAYHLYDSFNTTARAAHFAFLPYRPLTLEELAARNTTLTDPLEQFEEQRSLEWSATGSGYFQEQATKPNTIGLALQDHPVGQLAWIGEKFIDCKKARLACPHYLILDRLADHAPSDRVRSQGRNRAFGPHA